MIVNNINWVPFQELCNMNPEKKYSVKVYEWCSIDDRIITFEADLSDAEFCEKVQDCVWEAIEWYDYNDVLNQWLMENPFPIKHTIQASNGAATLNPDDIINFVLDNTVTKAPYVKALENPTANTWTSIVHNLNTPVPSLYAYDSANEYISLERKFVDDNTIEYRTTTNDPFTYYIKS